MPKFYCVYNASCSGARGAPGHGDHSTFIVFIMCIVLQLRTPLELEIAQLLHGSKNVFKKEKMLTPAEERALRAMNLEEVQCACVCVCICVELVCMYADVQMSFKNSRPY